MMKKKRNHFLFSEKYCHDKTRKSMCVCVWWGSPIWVQTICTKFAGL